jgi:hypothetical protein
MPLAETLERAIEVRATSRSARTDFRLAVSTRLTDDGVSALGAIRVYRTFVRRRGCRTAPRRLPGTDLPRPSVSICRMPRA